MTLGANAIPFRSYDNLLTERLGKHIAIAKFNRPAVRNAVNAGVAADLFDFVNVVESDPEIRVGIITGTGSIFCAGADLKEVSEGRDIRIPRPGGFAGFTSVQRTKPWIAALNGSAFGGGVEMTLACELVVVAEGAVLALTEVKRGLCALSGGVARAPRLLPPAIAYEMLLTGEPLSAERAFAYGLANRVVPAERVLDEALALAQKIADASPFSVRTSLRLARKTVDVSIEEMLKTCDDTLVDLFNSPDFKEGPRAFLEKRKPTWTS